MYNDHSTNMPTRVILAEDREIGRCELYESALHGHHIALLFVPRIPWFGVEHMFHEFDSMFRDVGASMLDEAKDRVMGNKVQFAIHCRFKKVSINAETREPEIKFDEKWVSLPSRAVESTEELLASEVRVSFQSLIKQFSRNGWI